MKESRMKKTLYNASFKFAYELVVAVCAFILPRLILVQFGSTLNGLTQSISQFIGCVALLKSGIGSVTRYALYKPLAENNTQKISAIVNATERYMRKVAIIFAAGVVVFACCCPVFVSKEYEWFFSFSLILIIAFSTFIQYYFGITYQMLIQANQTDYLISASQIVATIVNTVIASVLIHFGCTIHVVKLASTIAFAIPPMFCMLYGKRKFHIDKTVEPDFRLIDQRWDALGHQIANFINNNTDIMLITVFLRLSEVSVYSVYNMVTNSIKMIVSAISNGTSAAFGNMIANGEWVNLKKRFTQYETLMYLMNSVIHIITAILIVPFVTVYTINVVDTNYSRWEFGVLMCISSYITCALLPYEQLIFAAGKFKDTRRIASIQAILNIVTSIVLVNTLGIVGVTIGTIVAFIYKIIRYNMYISSNIMSKRCIYVVKGFLYTIVCGLVCYLIWAQLGLKNVPSIWDWIAYAVVVSISVFLICMAIGIFFYRDEMREIGAIIKRLVLRRT